jgi:hypothetical protein
MGALAQMVERVLCKHHVRGSNPLPSMALLVLLPYSDKICRNPVPVSGGTRGAAPGARSGARPMHTDPTCVEVGSARQRERGAEPWLTAGKVPASFASPCRQHPVAQRTRALLLGETESRAHGLALKVRRCGYVQGCSTPPSAKVPRARADKGRLSLRHRTPFYAMQGGRIPLHAGERDPWVCTPVACVRQFSRLHRVKSGQGDSLRGGLFPRGNTWDPARCSLRGVAQSGRVRALGARGRRFESCRPDFGADWSNGRTAAFGAAYRGSIPWSASLVAGVVTGGI